jgi:hypothetical protein
MTGEFEQIHCDSELSKEKKKALFKLTNEDERKTVKFTQVKWAHKQGEKQSCLKQDFLQ